MFEAFDKEFASSNLKSSYTHRQRAFGASIDRIIEHNSDASNTWQKGVNAYSDMTDDEVNQFFNLNQIADPQHCSATSRQAVEALKDIPSEWDWRNHNGVSPVKNQGKCGSCWTFSTVGTLEAHSLIKFGSFTPLAEQQLVDCAGAFDNQGCNGGLPSHAFEYIKYAGGISTETAYPYFAKDHNCTVKKDTFALATPDGAVNITEGDEISLKNAVFQHGPVSIAY